jgi:hypothetical protein
MAEDNRLSHTSILIKDLGAVLCGNRIQGLLFCARLGEADASGFALAAVLRPSAQWHRQSVYCGARSAHCSRLVLASNNMWHGSPAFLVGEVIMSVGYVCGLSHLHWFMDHPILAQPFL